MSLRNTYLAGVDATVESVDEMTDEFVEVDPDAATEEEVPVEEEAPVEEEIPAEEAIPEGGEEEYAEEEMPEASPDESEAEMMAALAAADAGGDFGGGGGGGDSGGGGGGGGVAAAETPAWMTEMQDWWAAQKGGAGTKDELPPEIAPTGNAPPPFTVPEKEEEKVEEKEEVWSGGGAGAGSGGGEGGGGAGSGSGGSGSGSGGSGSGSGGSLDGGIGGKKVTTWGGGTGRTEAIKEAAKVPMSVIKAVEKDLGIEARGVKIVDKISLSPGSPSLYNADPIFDVRSAKTKVVKVEPVIKKEEVKVKKDEPKVVATKDTPKIEPKKVEPVIKKDVVKVEIKKDVPKVVATKTTPKVVTPVVQTKQATVVSKIAPKTTTTTLAKKKILGDEPPRILPSPLKGVDDESWSKFVYAMSTAAVGSVSPSNAMGMFELKPKRLHDLGLVLELEYTRGPSGRMVWVCEFVPPMTANTFLRSPVLQYRMFAASMKDYIERLTAGTIPSKGTVRPEGMTLSGMLAILHRCGPMGLDSWINDERRFEETEQLYSQANGIF